MYVKNIFTKKYTRLQKSIHSLTHVQMALHTSLILPKKSDFYVLIVVFWTSWEVAVMFLSSDDVWSILSRSHSSATYFLPSPPRLIKFDIVSLFIFILNKSNVFFLVSPPEALLGLVFSCSLCSHKSWDFDDL